MMYRCRKLIALFLSLAIMASVFIISVYGEEQETFSKVFFNWTGSGNYGSNVVLANGAGGYLSLDQSDPSFHRFYFEIDNITASPADPELHLFIYFNIRFFILEEKTAPSVSWSGNSMHTNYNVRYFNDYTYKFDEISPYQYLYPAINVACKGGMPDPNVRITFTSGSYPEPSNQNWPSTIYFVIEDCFIGNNEAEFYRKILDSTNDIKTNVNNLNNHILYNNNWNWSSIEYDSNGDASITDYNGTWFESIHGLIGSLVAPIKEQVEQEQKAKDAGAYDALDDAFDNAGSSFGSLSDFGSIGQIARWDSDAYSDDVEDHILGWFSSATKNNIDNVQRNREDLHIVDFYSSNLEEILEVIGDGTTD